MLQIERVKQIRELLEKYQSNQAYGESQKKKAEGRGSEIRRGY